MHQYYPCFFRNSMLQLLRLGGHTNMLACLTAVLLCASSSRVALGQQARGSSVGLFVRLVSYENPVSILISGTKCDSGSSECDPSFALSVKFDRRHLYTPFKCGLTNINQVDFATNDNLPEFSRPIASEIGTKPTWVSVNVVVKDCLFTDPDETIGEFQSEFTNNQLVWGPHTNTNLLASSEDTARIVAMQPIRLTPESIKLRISVWTQCSPGFYGQDCDRYCQPNDACCCNKDGRLLCNNQLNSNECITRGAKATALPATIGTAKTRISSDEASRSSLIMLIAVVTSSTVSILVLVGTAILAVKMCKTSESNAIFIRQLQSATPAGGTSTASLDPLPLCRHHNSPHLQSQEVTLQPLGFLNPTSYNTLTTSSVAPSLLATSRPGRPDSGVYDEPVELPAASATIEMMSSSVSSSWGVPTLPARPLLPSQQQQQQQQREDVQRTPQSKSYSRRPLNGNNAE